MMERGDRSDLGIYLKPTLVVSNMKRANRHPFGPPLKSGVLGLRTTDAAGLDSKNHTANSGRIGGVLLQKVVFTSVCYSDKRVNSGTYKYIRLLLSLRHKSPNGGDLHLCSLFRSLCRTNSDPFAGRRFVSC